ncbi:MAG: HAMP domain-containing protein [Acidimicrobiia bacterium]
MRRRLAILSLATTILVVIAFLVPLGLLVRRQASDRARLDAERSAQSTASLIALAVVIDADPAAIESAVGSLQPGTIVVVSRDLVFGEPLPSQGSLAEAALARQATLSEEVEGGWELALPVIGRESTAVVDVFVTDEELTEGVIEAWLLLALLGVVLVGVAAWVADRLGQSLVRPIVGLASAARQLGDGDLETRVQVSEPGEIREVGESFNWLAGRLEELLAEEREAAADLSHRLRTPLTSLRLQAESLSDPVDREAMLSQVDRLEDAIDRLIQDTRSERVVGRAGSDLSAVVRARSAFWAVLADEQKRSMSLDVAPDPLAVALAAEAVEAVVDALIGNIFAHTAPGTGFQVAVGTEGGRPWLEVADEGPGFAVAGLGGRGVSGGGSTGLGLDIVRRTAELVDGSMKMNNRPGGGAVVRVWFGAGD